MCCPDHVTLDTPAYENSLLKVDKRSIFASRHFSAALSQLAGNGSLITNVSDIKHATGVGEEYATIFIVYFFHLPSRPRIIGPRAA